MNFNSIYEDPAITDKEYPSAVDGISFVSNNCMLIGTMYAAQGIGPHPTVILLHGIPGHEQNYDIAHILLRNGFNVMVFHYRGNWGSEGAYSLKHVLEDTENAIKFIKSKHIIETYRIDINNIILIGHSLGGFTALMTAAKHPEIKLAASIAGFNFGLYGQSILNDPTLIKQAVKTFDFITKPTIQGITAEEFIQETMNYNEEFNVLNITEKLNGHSVLIIGAAKDAVSQIDQHYLPIINNLKQANVNFKNILIDTDHSFSNKRIALAQELLKWLHAEIVC